MNRPPGLRSLSGAKRGGEDFPGGELPPIRTDPFGLTVAHHPRAWRVVHVQREWTIPPWFLDADDELPSSDL